MMSYKNSGWDSMSTRSRLRDARAFGWWVGFLVVFSLSMVLLASHARSDAASRWTTYGNDSAPKVTLITVKTVCLSAEDSAGHLRLRSYGGGQAVYGCAKRGY
jgi:hypothetical protein